MEINIKFLKDLVEAIGAAGDALAKIADGLKHLVTTGAEGYDATRARLVYAKLLATSADSVSISESQLRMVERLKRYAEELSDFPLRYRRMEWQQLMKHVASVTWKVAELMDEVRKDRSDFVLEPAYAKLRLTLAARIGLLERLQLHFRRPPTSPEELEVVRDVARSYEVLMEQLRSASDELNAYLKSLKAEKD